MNFVNEVKRFQNTKLNKLLMKHFNTLYNDFEVIEFNVDELDNDVVEFVKKINEYNKVFNEVKEFVDNLDIEDFDIKLNKMLNYGWYDYYRMKENGFEGNFEDYKNERMFNNGRLILKIRWKC